MKEKLQLPKTNDNGDSIISYSQVKLWNELKGYNTGLLGKHEYIKSYFFNEKFSDKGGFAEFGNDVEDYITKREKSECFTKKEKSILETISCLGIFQQKIDIELKGFRLIGYIDDCSSDYNHLRDIKTASLNSSKKYYGEDYDQLDFYAMAISKEHGFIPEKLEVVCVERNGNGFRGGRNIMNVGENIWYIERKTSESRISEIENKIIRAANEISDYYKIYKKLLKI